MFRALFALLLLPSLAFSQAEEKLEIRNLGQCGLVTRYASSQIGDTCLQEAENVYLDEDAGITRRKGFAKFNTTALTDSKSVRGVWPFRATDGTEYLVALSSETLFQSDGDGSFSAISPAIANLSSTQDMDCQQCLGKLWCVNGSDTMFFWDATSTGTVSGAPTCAAIDCFRNRIALSNCSGTLSQLRMSGELDGEDWTISASPASTSPIAVSIGGVNDGKKVQCIQGVYQDVLVLGKEDSTWGLYGFDRRDFAVREISREVGCIENRSGREKQGSLYWLSKRGVEKMTGPSITRVSDPIRDLVDTIIVAGGNSRSVTDTTQSDFEAGNLTASGAGAPMSATISPGGVIPSSSSFVDASTASFALGSGVGAGVGANDVVQVGFVGVTSTYTARYDATVQPESADPAWSALFAQTAPTLSAGTMTMTASGNQGWYRDYSASGVSRIAVFRAMVGGSNTSTAAFTVTQLKSGGGTAAKITLSHGYGGVHYGASGSFFESGGQNSFSTYTYLISTDSVVSYWRNGVFKASESIVSPDYATATTRVQFSGATNALGDGTAYMKFFYYGDSSAVMGNAASDIPSISTFTSRIYDTAFSTPTAGPFTSTETVPSGTATTYALRTSTSPNNDMWGAYETIVPPARPTSYLNRYWQYKATFKHLNLVESPGITGASLLASTTGYFISQCRNPGTAITQWGLFQCNRALNGGDMSFAISVGTTCHGVTRATATWTTQINNSVITSATNTFVAYRTLFDLDSSTETPTLNDCTINWNEGATRPSVTSEVYRDRYYLAYTSGTTGTVANDRLLVLDSRDQWVLHDQPNCTSLGIYNRKMYCGDSGSTGLVYQVDVGQDDDGASFTSNFRTKDFDFGNTWQKKHLARMYFDLAGLPDQSYSISLTPSYTLDASTDVVTLNAINLNEDYSRFIAAKVPADLSNNTSARWYNFGLTNTGAYGPWKIFGMKIIFSRLSED